MSRETQELSEKAFWENLLGKGKGDPDNYGYPGDVIKFKKAMKKKTFNNKPF